MRGEPLGIAALAAAAITAQDISVVIACIGGTYASFVWADKVEPRSRIPQLFVSCVIMGWAFTAVTNSVIGFVWPGLAMTNSAHAGLGAIVSCIARFWLPSLIESIKSGDWKNWIPFINRGK